MTINLSKTIPADYRQLIAQFKNLAFWHSMSCAIVSKLATVPSSVTASFDKTCYPSPKGRFSGSIGKPPFFLGVLRAKRRSVANVMALPRPPAFRRAVQPLESADNRGSAGKGTASCALHKKLLSQPYWPLGWAPACRLISNGPAWGPRSASARQSFWMPTRSPARSWARPRARCATTSPIFADPFAPLTGAHRAIQTAGGAAPRPVLSRGPHGLRAEGTS